MEKIKIEQRTLLGISINTNYNNELYLETSQIIKILHKYWEEEIANIIPNRLNPGITYVVYSNYDSNFKGSYNYFIGEEVIAVEAIPIGLENKIIIGGNYIKINSEPGPMPDVIIKTWQEIWAMPEDELENKRCYLTDFEIYDQRFDLPNAQNNPQIFTVYIGVK